MRRSQPVDPKVIEKLGIREETAEEKLAGQQVVKTEIVDEMFDFGKNKITLPEHINFFFRRMRERFYDVKWSFKNFLVWLKLISEHRPWDIHCFLPMFVKHLELYIDCEKRFGHSTEECREYKISTAQEAIDIINRMMDDDYVSKYSDVVEDKWGKFPYKKTIYANGNTGFEHLTPKGYEEEMHSAYEKAEADEKRDLERLSELIKNDMLNWWD